ncbi:MobL relaxases, partial [Dysosmobacter welbionis]
VPLHHLEHRPLEGTSGLFGIRHHRDQQVGNAVVGGQLHHLGIHHDKADLIRGGLVQQRHNQGVGAHGLAGSGGAGDQHVGQTLDIPHDVPAADIPSQGESHFGLVLCELPGLDHVPDQHRRHLLVGHLDAHHGDLVRNGGDPHAGGPQGQGDIIRQVGDLAELHA